MHVVMSCGLILKMDLFAFRPNLYLVLHERRLYEKLYLYFTCQYYPDVRLNTQA